MDSNYRERRAAEIRSPGTHTERVRTVTSGSDRAHAGTRHQESRTRRRAPRSSTRRRPARPGDRSDRQLGTARRRREVQADLPRAVQHPGQRQGGLREAVREVVAAVPGRHRRHVLLGVADQLAPRVHGRQARRQARRRRHLRHADGRLGPQGREVHRPRQGDRWCRQRRGLHALAVVRPLGRRGDRLPRSQLRPAADAAPPLDDRGTGGERGERGHRCLLAVVAHVLDRVDPREVRPLPPRRQGDQDGHQPCAEDGAPVHVPGRRLGRRGAPVHRLGQHLHVQGLTRSDRQRSACSCQVSAAESDQSYMRARSGPATASRLARFGSCTTW
ncbi:hypothetical protein CURTO8I2_140098 [Curtobacterium sp. 8I-2]|nr:hypothetical protein CURTO8I2_140098 [Curtobacterium sp. 8I-2]